MCALAITKNVDEHFPKEALDILDAFAVFNAELVLSDTNSNSFSACIEVRKLQRCRITILGTVKRRQKLWQTIESCRFKSVGLNLGRLWSVITR